MFINIYMNRLFYYDIDQL